MILYKLIKGLTYTINSLFYRIKPCSCAQFAPGCKFAPLASRSYANKLCPYVPRFDLKFTPRV